MSLKKLPWLFPALDFQKHLPVLAGKIEEKVGNGYHG